MPTSTLLESMVMGRHDLRSNASTGPVQYVLLTTTNTASAQALAEWLGDWAKVWQVHRMPAHTSTLISLAASPPIVLVEDVDDALLAAMREQWPKLRLIVCQTAPPAVVLDRMLALHARGWIARTATVQQRVQAIRKVADGGVWAPLEVVSELFDRSLPRAGPAARPDDGPLAWTPVATSRPVPAFKGEDTSGLAADLTPREHAVLQLVHQGMTNKEIARCLSVCAGTVKKHLATAFRKLGVRQRRQLFG